MFVAGQYWGVRVQAACEHEHGAVCPPDEQSREEPHPVEFTRGNRGGRVCAVALLADLTAAVLIS